jgi:exodeoxyribonuclease VII small subunit
VPGDAVPPPEPLALASAPLRDDAPNVAARRVPSTTPLSSENGDAPPVGFEAELKRLGEVVEKLEDGELGLEESLALFEEGVKLSRSAQQRLDAAEKRVEELIRIDENGDAVTRDLDPE